MLRTVRPREIPLEDVPKAAERILFQGTGATAIAAAVFGLAPVGPGILDALQAPERWYFEVDPATRFIQLPSSLASASGADFETGYSRAATQAFQDGATTMVDRLLAR